MQKSTLVNKNIASDSTPGLTPGQSCFGVLVAYGNKFFLAWMVMFTVALVGFPLGYFPCLLATATVTWIINDGTGETGRALTTVLKNASRKK